MTCQDVQNKILILPDPRRVPEPLREHLDGCPACLAWWKQAAWLERLLEQLPAPPPPADKKSALIDELTSAIEQAWQMSPAPSRVWVHTCNRDHPQALANYQARGMIIYKSEDSAK